jgi:hypothetical protein
MLYDGGFRPISCAGGSTESRPTWICRSDQVLVGSRATFQAAVGCYRFETGLKSCALGDWAFSPKTGTTTPHFQMHPSVIWD